MYFFSFDINVQSFNLIAALSLTAALKPENGLSPTKDI